MHIDIKSKLEFKHMRRYELAQKIDVTYPTITAIYNSTSTSIRFDTLEKICRELDCTPNDILIFDDVKNENTLSEDVFNNVSNNFEDFMNKPQKSGTI